MGNGFDGGYQEIIQEEKFGDDDKTIGAKQIAQAKPLEIHRCSCKDDQFDPKRLLIRRARKMNKVVEDDAASEHPNIKLEWPSVFCVRPAERQFEVGMMFLFHVHTALLLSYPHVLNWQIRY